MKTKIILPFKDDLPARRFWHCLDFFLPKFKEYIESGPKFNYEIIVVEEHTPETITFNLGRTINIGFDIVKDQMEEHDMFMFHPVDLLPKNTNYSVSVSTKFCMKGYRPHPSFVWPRQKILDGHYYYKAICLTKSDYQKLNGFTNNFVGWGGEDDEFFLRMEFKFVDLEISVSEYERLTHDGSNGPNFPRHLETIHKSVREGKCTSGLDDLQYEILDVVDYKGFKKYIVR